MSDTLCKECGRPESYVGHTRYAMDAHEFIPRLEPTSPAQPVRELVKDNGPRIDTTRFPPAQPSGPCDECRTGLYCGYPNSRCRCTCHNAPAAEEGSGVCHCGAEMEGHPVWDNHSPVEMMRPAAEPSPNRPSGEPRAKCPTEKDYNPLQDKEWLMRKAEQEKDALSVDCGAGDVAETIQSNPKSWIAWKRKAEELRVALEDANSLCRSAHSIAERKGLQTNWEAFTAQLKRSLDLQHKAMYSSEPFFPLEHVGEPAPGWISVEERLPEEGKYVLVFEPVGGIFVGFHIRLSWCDSRGITRSLEQVTHWQPLPKPPAASLQGGKDGQ